MAANDPIRDLTTAITDLGVQLKQTASNVAADLESYRRQRRRWLAGSVALLAAGAVAVFILFAHVSEQTIRNQHHVDCAITFALANDPPKCQDVKKSLASDHIPTTPNMAAQPAPGRNAAVNYIICQITKAVGVPSPEGVPC